MRKNMYAAVVAFLPTIFLQSQELLDPLTQGQFVNRLSIPSVIDARQGGTVTLTVTQFRQDLGLKDPVTGAPLLTAVWGYNGTYPGPSIAATKNIPLDVFWHNNLVDEHGQVLPHLLPVDTSVHWAMSGINNWQQYGVPIVTHLHGGHSESASDGLPESWFTPGFNRKGPGFVKGDIDPFHYDNDQEAATLWYHDHALGITRLNVYAGLAGFYILTDENETALKEQNKLPSGPYDIGIVIQDRMFDKRGQLFYPTTNGEDDDGEIPVPTVLPEFFGDFILVNGALWPVLEVEPRPYRFRFLNGSDSRFYNLFLSSGQTIQQVGTDNGLLPSPVTLQQMLMGTGERRDVVIDFSNFVGQTIILRNNAKTPFPKGSAVHPKTTGRIMAFKVTKPLDEAVPKAVVPAVLRPPITPLQTNLPARKLILFEAEDEFDRLKPMLGTFENGVLGWDDPITENPALNSTEIWEIYNETMDAHTLHLHLVTMQLLSRQRFIATVDETNGKPSNVKLLGNVKFPTADEAGWKDTYVMYPGEVTRIITRFNREGVYVWHCHILSHEDHEMMRPYYVGNMPGNVVTTKTREADNDAEQQLQVLVQPNPFTNLLRAGFTIKQNSTVIVNVYSSNGSLVKQVYNGTKEAGRHQFIIDGSPWSKGTYFLEMVIGDQRVVRKLVLQK